MADPQAVLRAMSHLHQLCSAIPTRRVGSAGNRAATAWFSAQMAALGLSSRCATFDCLDWHQAGADLGVAGAPVKAFVSPYSPGCRVAGPLRVASDLATLAMAQPDEVVLLRGELAREPLMPKGFTFYNPEHHRRIIALLEERAPLAIIAATARSPELAGAAYPCPLIADGDFDIPSVYLSEEQGEALAAKAGSQVALEIRAERTPATGCNVISRIGAGAQGRVVVMAHMDAVEGSPGAVDNATGVVLLLLLAERLAGYAGKLAIELVAMNGEDYYSNPGEMLYLRENEGAWDDILLGINLDGVGYRLGRTAYSLYNCPPPLAEAIQAALAPHAELVAGEPWVQGDHGLFLMHGRPALALTAERARELLAEYIHTPADAPALVDPHKLVAVAGALNDLLRSLATPASSA